MSLINDALKDLEQRERKTALDVEGTIANETKHLGQTGWRRLAFGGTLGALVVLLIYQGMLFSDLGIVGKGSGSDIQAIELIDTSMIAPEQGAMVKRHVAAANKRKSRTERKTSDSLTVSARKMHLDKVNVVKFDPILSKEQVQQIPEKTTILNDVKSINTLLELAQESMIVNRLTRPKGENALYYYQQVLQRDPGNEHARKGLAGIRQQYLALLNDGIANKRQARAHQLSLRLHLVDNSDDLLASYQQKIAAIYTETSPSDDVHELTGDDNKTIFSDREYAQKQVKQSSKNKMTENMTIAQSSETRDNILFQKASDLVANNQTKQAIMLLEKNCQVHLYCDKSLIYQFDLYLQNSRYSDAKIVATQLENQAKKSELRHAALPYIQAKLANYRYGAVDAIAILESSPAREPYLEEQLRLLAALYQSEKQYAKSYTLYKRLVVDSDYRNENDVLGLAVSADMLGKPEQAYFLYQRLQSSQAHSGTVGKFITQRINVLRDVSLVQQP